MTESSGATESASEQLNRLQKRVGALERQVSATPALSALGSVLVGGATLLLIGLALPWMGEKGSSAFGSSAQTGWEAYTSEPLAVVLLLLLLTLLGLAVATAAGRSPVLHLITHVVADVTGLFPLALVVASLREGSTVAPGTGCYTMLIGALAIAVAALVRRSRLES
ncbi:hypothetical protein [Flindersiella endophytica]